MNRLRPNPLPVIQLRDALKMPAEALPDSELLDRFTGYADHAAFDTLLRRHGPMVLGVCRRTLRDSADADDAFQATFLVFLRKAKSVRGERLGPWLYGVAWRVAQKARARAARFAAYRTEGTEMIPAPETSAAIPDWLPVLDAELNALPAKYRDALVLCELEGASRADAAKALGLREGTLSSRLARGRELLRKRLLKHGTLLPLGGLAALFTANGVGRGSVPAALLARVSELAKTGAAAGAVPVVTARLTDEVMKSMFLTKLRIAAGALTLLSLATVGLASAWVSEAPTPRPNESGRAQAPDKKTGAPQPDTTKPAGPKLTDRDALQGTWLLEKYEAGNGASPEDVRAGKEMIGKGKLCIAADIWVLAMNGRAGVSPWVGMIKPTKNPKWIDLSALDDNSGIVKGIYELDGDRLRLSLASSADKARPAEFSSGPDAPSIVMEFRRDKSPLIGQEEGWLLGDWRGEPVVMKAGATDSVWTYTPRAIVIPGHLFVLVPSLHPQQHGPVWVGGEYTVDATKNPKWIDVELVAPFRDDKTTKLYGSYEVADRRLRLALGAKRATRPLEFADADGVLLFGLKTVFAEK